jgi:16S rRNA (cytosine1402-N4)-methyltransferase
MRDRDALHRDHVEPRHVSVLPAEVIEYLAPAPGQTIVDATLGAGGHSHLIQARLGAQGRLISIDRDPAMVELARTRLREPSAAPVTFALGDFAELRSILDGLGIEVVDGILADLGICSDQLDAPERGFSFQLDSPLDMRMNPDEPPSAKDLVGQLSERELADLIYRYGEERFSRRIARRIVEARRERPIATTAELAELVRRCVPRPKGRQARIDPATRTFQALRIAVNDELGSLERLLHSAHACVKPGGRMVVISFHSLEDRLVKQEFRNRNRWENLTRKPIQASDEEIRQNPRARSAKLRAARLRTEEAVP